MVYTARLEKWTLYDVDTITAQCLTFFGTKCAIKLLKKKKSSQKSLSFPLDYCMLLL